MDYVKKVIESGWWSKGSLCSEFEKEISEYVGAKYALALSSCTAGLHILCELCGFKENDEVITSPITFCSTVNAVLYTGATPIFCDIDKNTGVMDCDKLEGCITERTKGIIAVHYAGNACDMDKIMSIADKYNLKVIEDCAHALGTYYKGKHCGGFGVGGAFSFYATKNLATGEGGMITTNNEEYYNKASVVSLHGMDKNAYKRYQQNGSFKYDVVCTGYKYNMTDIAAGIGIAQLQSFKAMQRKRSDIASLYSAILSEIDAVKLLAVTENTVPSNHLYIISVREETRDIVMERLRDKYKVGTSVHFMPITSFSNYKDYKKNTPIAEEFAKGIISLPIYPSMELEDAKYVAEAIREITTRI